MKKKLSVIFIFAALMACVVFFTACVENVATASDLYGDWYHAGNYSAESDTPDVTITDYNCGVTLGEKDGEPWAYLTIVPGYEESYYALYDLVTGNDISLKEDNRWGQTIYTLNILSEDVISLTITPSVGVSSDDSDSSAEGEAITYYFVKQAE